MGEKKEREGTTKEHRIYLTYRAAYDRLLSRPEALMHTANTWAMPIKEIKPILVAEEAKVRGIPLEEAIEKDRIRTQAYRARYEQKEALKNTQDTKYYFL